MYERIIYGHLIIEAHIRLLNNARKQACDSDPHCVNLYDENLTLRDQIKTKILIICVG